MEFKLGDKLLINTNELTDEIVEVVDLTSDGVPFCVGDNFEGWVPILTPLQNKEVGKHSILNFEFVKE